MSIKEKKYTVFQIAINLTAACFISGVIIAGVYFVTAPISVKNAEMLKEKSMKELVTNATEFKNVSGKESWYEALNNGKVIAYIVQTESKGYGGPIKIMTAIDPNGAVIGYNVLSHNETPGLGDRTMVSPFKDQFIGKTVEALKVVKDATDKKDIQAITGSTISSKAVTDGVKLAAEEVSQYIGGK
ncbi:MAG: RnfABCDGE type electron transport complex subunit G [Peptostreptococcaceae bacterium]